MLRVHSMYENSNINPPVNVDVVEYVDPQGKSLQQIIDGLPTAVKVGAVICPMKRLIIEELGEEVQILRG